MPIGNANIHIQINLSVFINKLVSFLFCEFKRVTSLKEGKKKFYNVHLLKLLIEILFSFSRSTNVNVNMSFPNSNFEGNLCYASHFDIIMTCKVNVGHRDIYYAKNIKFFHMCGG